MKIFVVENKLNDTYPEQYKNATGEGLWSGKYIKVSQEDGDINVMERWQYEHYISSAL